MSREIPKVIQVGYRKHEEELRFFERFGDAEQDKTAMVMGKKKKERERSVFVFAISNRYYPSLANDM